MDIIKQIKDPDSLYQGNLIDHDDGRIECPVCHAMYKRRKSAEKHFAKQDCYSVLDLFADTPYEEAALELYQSIISEKNPRARTTLQSFRKSNSYSSVVRFCAFCYANEVDDFGLYYSYMEVIRNFTIMNAALANAINEETLREFRIFLHQNYRYVDSKTFWDRHGEQLLEDDDFFIRSLEKAHITLNSVAMRKKAKDKASELPIGYQLRMVDLTDKVYGKS